ncbi:MAG: hypothetical protein ACI823_001840, partial [Chitinophagales bacterium]
SHIWASLKTVYFRDFFAPRQLFLHYSNYLHLCNNAARAVANIWDHETASSIVEECILRDTQN